PVARHETFPATACKAVSRGRTPDRIRNMNWAAFAIISVLSVCAFTATGAEPPREVKEIRVGIIGLDTSHVVAFTKLLNDPKAAGELAGLRVVAAFAGGSKDIPASRDRVDKFTQQVREMGVRIVDSIPAL